MHNFNWYRSISGTPGFPAGMDKPGLDSNAPGPGPGLDKKFLPRDQAGTNNWKSPGSRAGSRAEISTPCRDPDKNLSPAQTSGGYTIMSAVYLREFNLD